MTQPKKTAIPARKGFPAETAFTVRNIPRELWNRFRAVLLEESKAEDRRVTAEEKIRQLIADYVEACE